MDICPNKGWHPSILTAQNTFNILFAFNCFLSCKTYFARWSPKNYIFTDSFTNSASHVIWFLPCGKTGSARGTHFLVGWMAPEVEVVMEAFSLIHEIWLGSQRQRQLPPQNRSVAWFWCPRWWQTTAPSSAQFCGVPQGIIPGSLIYFSNSPHDPM